VRTLCPCAGLLPFPTCTLGICNLFEFFLISFKADGENRPAVAGAYE
jgi:hypothetical protein